jgi:hypothetical protein
MGFRNWRGNREFRKPFRKEAGKDLPQIGSLVDFLAHTAERLLSQATTHRLSGHIWLISLLAEAEKASISTWMIFLGITCATK